MVLDLAEVDGVTTLTFGQSLPDPAWAESVGPGWDYYLDRLVAAEDRAATSRRWSGTTTTRC